MSKAKKVTSAIHEHSHDENCEHEHGEACGHDHSQEAQYEYQFLSQQYQQLQQTIATVSKHREELRRLESNLDELSQLKGKNKSLIPLGSGIYIKGEIESEDSVYMNVGSGVVVKKNFSAALETIRAQLAEMEAFMSQLEGNMQELVARLQELQIGMQGQY